MQTAPSVDTGCIRFRVTHPHHVLCGREFDLLIRGSHRRDRRVHFRDEDGRLRWLPLEWTSLASPDPFVVVSAGRAFCRPEDLLVLAALARELLP